MLVPKAFRASSNRNGGRHRCQPPLRRAKDLPVFTVQIPGDPFQKSWLTSSGVASHLTTPSEEETDHLLDRASRRLARLSTIGAWQSQSRPMFRGPSWVDHSCVSLCSSARRLPNRVALEEDQLFRRLFPTG